MERKRLHRIHGLGIESAGRGTVIMLPSGGGKSTLALSFLRGNNPFRLISEDSPLLTRDGKLLPFPLRIGHDPWHKVGPSRVFNWLVGCLTGVRLHDHNCGFKCYRREIFDEVQSDGELHRFVPLLAAARGWKVGEIAVHHRARKFGRSKYGVRRFVKGFLDLLTVYFLTGYSQRPQHLLGTLGLFSFILGGLGVLALTIWWIVSRTVPQLNPVHLHERAIFYYSMGALLLGAQFITVGFLAEMLTAYHTDKTRSYSIKERIGPR